MDIEAHLKGMDLPSTKYVKRMRVNELLKDPDLAIEVIQEMMGRVSDGWDGGKSGNFKAGFTSSARVSLANLVRSLGMDWTSIFGHIQSTPVLMDEWNMMNKARAQLLAGEIIDIADEPVETMVEAVDKKTRIDVRKWVAERDDRTSFAPRTTIESTVTIEINKIADLNDRKRLADQFVDGIYTVVQDKVAANEE